MRPMRDVLPAACVVSLVGAAFAAAEGERLRVWPPGSNEGRENVFVNVNPVQERD